MIKILLALIILGVALAVVGLLLWWQGRDQRREVQAKAALKEIRNNPDAAYLYAQGLSPAEIEAAVELRNRIK